MRIRLERESDVFEQISIKCVVEIESDDPSWAMRKAKELLAEISEPEVWGPREAGSDPL